MLVAWAVDIISNETDLAACREEAVPSISKALKGGWTSPLALGFAGLGLISLLAWARWWWIDAVVPWDSKNQFFAFFRFMAGELAAGRSPFWNPYHYGGHPAIADPQSLIFQPAFVLWGLLVKHPTLREFDTLVFAHLVVGGAALLVMGRRLGWPVAPSLLAATVFMLGGSASGRLNHTGIIIVYGLFPLAWLLMDMALERRSWVLGLAFAGVASVILLGRNQVALMLAFALAALALRQALIQAEPVLWVRRRLWLFVGMALFGLLIIVVPMLLTLQLAALSNRPSVSLDQALEASLHPINLATMFIANIFGQHSGDYAYWGPNAETLPAVAATDDSFNYLYLGMAPAVIVLWFGLAGRQFCAAGNKTWAIILGLSLLFALGRYAPVFPFIFEYVPGFAFFRRPADGTFLIGIAMAVLSGSLLAQYVRNGLPRPSPLASALVLAGVASILAGALMFSSAHEHGWPAVRQLALAIPVFVIVTSGLALARSRGQRELVAAGLAVATAAQLVFWNAASRLNAEDRTYYEVLDRSAGEEAQVLSLLAREIARRHAIGDWPRVEIAGIDGPWQNVGMVRGIEAINGYNPLRIGVYDRFVAPGEIGAFLDTRQFPPTFASYDCPLARALDLEYIILAQPIETYPNIRRPHAMELILAGPKAWIYRLPPGLPRVRVVSKVIVADATATTADGRLVHSPEVSEVVIDRSTPPRRTDYGANNQGGTARITQWSPSRVDVKVDAPVASMLVLNDSWYPGWVAEVDGKPVPILRADVLFRAVEVPAGTHKVEFSYRPLSVNNILTALRTEPYGRAVIDKSSR